MGFVFPWQVWLKTELKDFCDSRIKLLAQRQFMQRESLLNQWNGYLNGSANVRWLDMWLCTVLENWMEVNGIEN
jgi:asparagine synthase (glutamine-hydrolysing)